MISQTNKIAIIDDEQDMRQSISQWLALSGYQTQSFARAEDALKEIGAGFPGIVISDIRMPAMDGMQLLKRLMSIDSALPVILITGHGDVPMAVEAMRLGAFDFLEKPFNPERMSELARKASQARRLTLDSRALRQELSEGSAMTERLIGESGAMNKIREEILDIAQAEENVLIDGETGTGKTLIAHALHAASGRAAKKFVLVSCSAFEDHELEKRLFGPMQQDDLSLPAMEEARGGTLVLEDIETLSEGLQARLLDALSTKTGASETRVIGISNQQGGEKALDSILRSDLYYRLCAFHITTPALRDRGRDILTLFTHYTDKYGEEYGCDAPKIDAQEAAQLLQAPWPGNVRQLINTAERAVLQARRGGGSLSSLLIDEQEDVQARVAQDGKPLKEHVEAFERMLIDNAMRRHRGAIAAVMEELRLPRRTLNEKMSKYGLQRADYL